jgi:cytochrome c oxidase subunit 2
LCAELCGTGHSFMRGAVVVDSDEDYQLWLQDQLTFAQLILTDQIKVAAKSNP